MAIEISLRTFIHSLPQHIGEQVLLRGWVHRLRTLANTTFIVIRDCTGEAQCVLPSQRLREMHIKLDDAIELTGRVRSDHRARAGCEVDVDELRVLNSASHQLPFNSSSDLATVSMEIRVEYRPLAARSAAVGNVFRIQAALLKYFREYLQQAHFTEIISSKLVAAGTEGGTQLFAVDWVCRTCARRRCIHAIAIG